MKRIVTGIIVGFFVSLLIFIWGWYEMEKSYLNPKQIADQNLCSQLEICQKCDRNYECLKNECSNNSVIENKCQEIKENWKTYSLELTDENFVSMLCDKNDDFYKKNCLEKQNRNLKLELIITLTRILSKTGINDVLIQFGVNNSTIPGVITLFTPPFLGFIIGYVSHLYNKGKRTLEDKKNF